MLEGLEVSELKKSCLYEGLRIDAETYKPFYLEIEGMVRRKSYTSLDVISSSIKKGIFDIKSEVYADVGIPFVRISNLKNMRIETSNIVYIPELEDQKNIETSLRKGDIILSKTAYPAASIVQLDKCNTSQDTVAIKLKDSAPILSGYLVVFLNTKYGLNQMLRWFTGNIQMHLNLEDCKGLFIYEADIGFQKMVEVTFWKALNKYDQSILTYSLAETFLGKEVGLNNSMLNLTNSNHKQYSQSYATTGRLDAEYYQPKYEAYESAVQAYKKGWTTIEHEFDLVKEASARDKKSYNYIEISDVNVGDGSASYTTRPIEELPDNAKIEAKRGDLLVSKVRPNRGAVSIIDFDDTDLIVSGAFTVLRQKAGSHFSNEMLKVLLRTPIYKDWMLKFNVGTQYPVIRDEDVLNLPIPKLDAKIQQDISAKVQEAQSLKKQSESLLDIAKRGVEMAIEQDEKSAEAWMRKECKALGVDLDSKG